MTLDYQTAAAIETAEAEAFASMSKTVPAEYAHRNGLSAIEIGGARVGMFRALDHPMFNRAIALGMNEPATEAMVEDVLAMYHALGIQNFRINLSPAAQPAQLPEWLEARGMTVSGRTAKFYRGPETPAECQTSLRIVRAGKDDALTFGAVMREGFGMPDLIDELSRSMVGAHGWHCYLALDDQKPVACAAMFLTPGAAWLGCATTLEVYRGRGVQRAMLAQRIRDGLEAGCRLFTVETGMDTPESGNPSYRNMPRSGFHLAYARPSYKPGEAQP